MNAPYIHRSIETDLKRVVELFPSFTLTGPRQSGKTTLIKHLFGESYRFVSMDNPATRALAEEDPNLFFKLNPPPLIIDEAQYAPIIFNYVKQIIDDRRSEKGLFILSGSQNFALIERITESLAGRTVVKRLMPLSLPECSGDGDKSLPWERDESNLAEQRIPSDHVWHSIWKGYYPELSSLPDAGWDDWHGSYIQLYMERDVRSLRQVGDLNQFQAFIRMIAARSAQLLNLNDIARDLAISANTVKNWLSVLEASFMIVVLRPYFSNVGKRLVKMPKVYFTDTGTLCYLLGYTSPELAATGPMAGPIFETAVAMEVFKRYIHRGGFPRLYFWRTSAGAEVDLLIENGQQIIPVEIKTTTTLWPSLGDPIRTFFKDFPDRVTRGYVIHPGDQKTGIGHNVYAYPFADF